MRLNAYTLLGDPSFLAASVASYYDAVDRVVVSFDEAHLGWAGDAIPIEACLNQLRHVDVESKIDLRPGDFSHFELPLTECETRHRQAALDAASDGADWVIQLDGDEVVPDLRVFVEMIKRADAAGAAGLDFPSRWIYARTRGGRFLEGCSRWWRPAAAYPGPLAVRAGSKLSNARQCEADLFRVDFRTRNTDPWRYAGHPVDATVPVDAGVLHFSWVRTIAEMNAKAQMSPHRDGANWPAEIRRWQHRQRHPWLTTAMTPFRKRGELHPQWLRMVSLPITPRPRFESPEN
jgi:hypothetical protein